MTAYTCSQCGLTVRVEDAINPADTKLIKACGCDAPVIANIESTLSGAGGVE